MRAILAGGHIAEIENEGQSLVIIEVDGSTLFTLAPPGNAAFYQFARHAVHGECPVVSFEPGHAINGWMDWYYRVDVSGQSIERLNPWR